MTADEPTASLAAATRLQSRDGVLAGRVHPGWDVYGIPHGGYLLALAGQAVLQASGAPDLFSITAHYLRKADHGPIAFTVSRQGGSRRFTTLTATGHQGDAAVMTVMASVGDRDGLGASATWTDQPVERLPDAALSPPAGDATLPFPSPEVAVRLGLRVVTADTGFATGDPTPPARIRAEAHATGDEAPDQLLALVACDATPPAVWSAIGMTGWVPTVELTAHVRARPAPGPLWVDVRTRQVGGGFCEEDALVHDAAGRLVLQSRQLARVPAT